MEGEAIHRGTVERVTAALIGLFFVISVCWGWRMHVLLSSSRGWDLGL